MAITAVPGTASAQGAEADRQVSFSIPAQGLSGALRQLAEASGLQLVYDTRITDGKESPGVSGTMSGRAALAAVLAGSGLDFQFSGDRTVIITARPAGGGASSGSGDGIRAVGVVSVEGAAGFMPFGEMVSPVNGINGSRDVQATEGTGSYTTGAASIVSKIPVSLKDTPQTVSVITSQRLADQNLISIKDILQAMPGITTTPGATGEEFEIYSRGFRVTTYSYDGGAPVFYDGNARPMLNIAEYDSVQLARGATGLFGGYGDPGGMVNLVRKKPLDHEQFLFEQDIGSWNNFRSMVDYTGPLTKDKSLRARIVASHQKKDYYYDIANSEKTGIYGILEYDLTPKTLVTVGASGNWENSVLNISGLPRYSDGTAIDWPVSTCFCVPGAGENAKKISAFAKLTHQISDRWSTTLNAMYDKQYLEGDYLSAAVSWPYIKPGTTTGGATISGQHIVNPTRQVALDYSVTGKIKLLGREHTLAIGANYQYVNRDGGYTNYYNTISIPSIFNYDPYGNYNLKFQNPGKTDYEALRSRIESYGIYGNLGIQLLKPLRVNIGMRYSSYVGEFIQRNWTWDSTYSYKLYVTQPLDRLRDRNLSKPNLGVNLDITKNLALYGSSQDIYKVQTSVSTVLAGTLVPPITGNNSEVGIKWESPNKKFNVSLAGFKVLQNGVLGTDSNNQITPVLSDTRAKGVEIEANGEVLPGWQVSANYTYNENSITTQNYYTKAIIVAPKTSYTPRHLGKLWTTYRGAAGSALEGVILGGGANVFSSSYQSTSFCAYNSITKTYVCTPYPFTTNGYVTFSLKGGYQLTKNVEISTNINNLTNKKTYLATNQQQVGAYNYYIEPRSFMVTTRFKW